MGWPQIDGVPVGNPATEQSGEVVQISTGQPLSFQHLEDAISLTFKIETYVTMQPNKLIYMKKLLSGLSKYWGVRNLAMTCFLRGGMAPEA